MSSVFVEQRVVAQIVAGYGTVILQTLLEMSLRCME